MGSVNNVQTAIRPGLWHQTIGSRAALVAALSLVVVLYMCSPSFDWPRVAGEGPYGGDALQEWLGGYVVLYGDYSQFYNRDYAIQLQHDEAVVGYNWDESEYLPLVYPPFYYLATSPLGMLPARHAAIIWSALMLAAGVGAIGLWSRAWPVVRNNLGWVCLAVAFYSPLVRNLAGGQKATVILAILTGTYLLLRSQRNFAAGIVFGLLLFKPQFAPLFVFMALVKRDWSLLAGFAVTAAICGLASLSLGLDVCVQYVNLVLSMGDYIQTTGYRYAEAHSWQGFFALLLGAEHLTAIKILTGVCTVLTVVFIWRAFAGRLDWTSPRGMLQFAAIVLASLIISPHMLTYDLTIVLLPVLLCALAAMDDRLPREYRSELFVLAAGVYVATAASSSVATATSVQLSTLAIGVAILWLSSMSQRLR